MIISFDVTYESGSTGEVFVNLDQVQWVSFSEKSADTRKPMAKIFYVDGGSVTWNGDNAINLCRALRKV